MLKQAAAKGAPIVLIVDDSAANRLVLQRQVAELGARALQAENGLEAVNLARQHEVALILLDLQMPTMDGFEAARQLRASPRTAQIPIIMITAGRVGLADRQRGLELGAMAYLHREDLDFGALKAQMGVLLDLHARANVLQGQISKFLDDNTRLAAENEHVGTLQDGLQRHLLLDELTGLTNRMFFDLHLHSVLKRSARGSRGFALAWIDLDHLKRINDRYGREVGDGMLVAVAQRMETVVRSSDVLARIKGGSFGLILDGISTAAEAQLVLKKVVAAAGEALELVASAADNSQLTLIPTLSVGVSLYPRHGKDRVTLLGVASKCAADVLRLGGDGVRVGWGGDAPPDAAAPSPNSDSAPLGKPKLMPLRPANRH